MLLHDRYSHKALSIHLVQFISSVSCPLPDSTRAPLLLDLRSSLRPSDHDRDLGRRRKRRLRCLETWPKHALDTAASSAGLMAGAAICARLCPWHALVLAARGSVALHWGLPVCPAHPPSQGCTGHTEARLGPITSPTRPLSLLSLCHSASLTLCLSLVFSRSAELALMQRPHVLLSAALLKLQTRCLSLPLSLSLYISILSSSRSSSLLAPYHLLSVCLWVRETESVKTDVCPKLCESWGTSDLLYHTEWLTHLILLPTFTLRSLHFSFSFRR